jgi:hypothetical protein
LPANKVKPEGQLVAAQETPSTVALGAKEIFVTKFP